MPGTLKSFTYNGLTYRVMGEADANIVGGVYENTPINHSGGSTPKKVRRNQAITGMILDVTAGEMEDLKAANDEIVDFPGNPMSIEDVEGNVYQSSGFINVQGMTTQENAATVDVHPMVEEGWTLFLA